MIEAEQERSELTLTGGPRHERQVRFAMDEFESSRLGGVGFDVQMSAVEDRVVDELAILRAEEIQARE